MAQCRSEIVAWVARNIIPHEAVLRTKLRRMSVSAHEIDDIVQDAYVAISQLKSVAHIRHGRAYLFTTARMVLLQRIRRDRIVTIDSLTEAEALALEDTEPNPERVASGRRELERVRRLIGDLPPRCREIFELRRVQGVPQKQIAAQLGVSEPIVEQQSIRGLKLILKAIAAEEQMDGLSPKVKDDDDRGRHGRA